jgi:hypothetical protein
MTRTWTIPVADLIAALHARGVQTEVHHGREILVIGTELSVIVRRPHEHGDHGPYLDSWEVWCEDWGWSEQPPESRPSGDLAAIADAIAEIAKARTPDAIERLAGMSPGAEANAYCRWRSLDEDAGGRHPAEERRLAALALLRGG